MTLYGSDIVFEVEAYKYKAVAQLIKTLPVDCRIHSFMIARRMSQPAATDHGCPLCFIDFPSLSMAKNYANI